MVGREGAAIASPGEWMPAESGVIRVNHCQIAAMRKAARAQCGKAFACAATRCGLLPRTPPRISGNPSSRIATGQPSVVRP
jgi:hypothetical protein